MTEGDSNQRSGGLLLKRSRTVSFRLSEEQFLRFQQLREETQSASISDLVRTAVEMMISSERKVDPLAGEVRELRARLHEVAMELRRVSARIKSRDAESDVTEIRKASVIVPDGASGGDFEEDIPDDEAHAAGE